MVAQKQPEGVHKYMSEAMAKKRKKNTFDYGD